MEKLQITQEQANKLEQLRLTALAKKVIYETAKEEKEKAYEIEHQAEQNAVAEYNKQYNTNYKMSYMIENEEDFKKYLYILQNEYLKLGIKNEYNNVYGYEFLKKFLVAEKDYLMTAVEFLRIADKNEIADIFEKQIKTYLKEEYKERLLKITENFIMGVKINE